MDRSHFLWGNRKAGRKMFDLLNILRAVVFRFMNNDYPRESSQPSPDLDAASDDADTPKLGRKLLTRWWRSMPLTIRVPAVSGALMLAVALAVSRLMVSFVAHEQELGVRQIAAVYLDGIATTVYPHVVARNLANTNESLRRTMWFHQGMREQRAIVQLPDGTIFADVAGPTDSGDLQDPLHNAALRQQLEQEGGFVFDASSGTGWASRAIVRDGQHVADLYVAVELKALIEERNALHHKLLLAAILSGSIAASIGFLVVHRMILPIRLLTERLRRAQTGDFECVAPHLLPPSSSEYGQLIRGFNDLIAAIGGREALAAKLAQRERESVLGRLAATIAHEVRNPLSGMSTALNTIRKFGDNPNVRAVSLDLIERGLWSIGDVVTSVLAFHRMPQDSRRLTAPDLDDLRTLIEPELTSRQLRLVWESEIAGAVDVAATETRQIALNLLLNACRASPLGGEVEFRVWIRDSDASAEKRQLVLQVVDNGPGLPETVSMALTSADITNPQDSQRGLGIRIIRDLVRALDGWIVATKVCAEYGSCIVVTLPLRDGIRQEALT